MLIDPQTMELRRVIRTPGDVCSNRELERMRRFLTDGSPEPSDAFWMFRDNLNAAEPFAVLHKHAEE